MELRRVGEGRAEVQVSAAEELRDDMVWWWRSLMSRLAKSLQFADCGGFVWRPRLRDLREKALSTGPEAACAIYTDSAGTR